MATVMFTIGRGLSEGAIALLSKPLFSSSLELTLISLLSVSKVFTVAYKVKVTAFSLPTPMREMFQTPFPI